MSTKLLFENLTPHRRNIHLCLLTILFVCYNSISSAQILDLGDTLKLTTLNYGLVGYYPFTGNAGDSSGLNNHGTEKNGVSLTTDRFSNPNSAYLFDGVNDYIEIADDNSLDVTDSFSITLWMNQYTASSGGYRLFDKTSVGINDGYNFDTYGSGGGRKLRMTGGLTNVEANVSFPLNTWNQVLVIHYKDSSYLYQNSSLIGKGVQKQILSNNLNARIGLNQTGGNAFNGKIDDIRVYNRALCDLEIKVVYGLILTLGVKASSPSVCLGLPTNINIVNPQPYMQYKLLNKQDSSIVGLPQASPCSDTLRFSTGNLTSTQSFILRAIDNSKSDSIYLDTTITITVIPPYNDTVDTNLCGLSGVMFNGILRTTPGFYVGNFKNKIGCDSTVTLHLENTGFTTYPIDKSICNGDSIYLQKAYRKIAGTYYDTTTRAGNCDSVSKTTLTILSPTSGSKNFSLCLGDSVLVNNRYLKSAGLYSDTLVNSVGCDSIITVQVTNQSVYYDTVSNTICNGDSVFVFRRYFKISGSYSDTSYNGSCADSIRLLNLTILPTHTSSSTQQICSGDFIVVNNKQVTQAGTYYDSLKNNFGCDSIVTITLTISSPPVSNLNFKFCLGDSIAYNGSFYKNDTIFYDTLKTSNGCDSVQIVTLTPGRVETILPDSSFFCEGILDTLNPGANYLSYLWNTGATSQTIIPSTQQVYWVTVVDSFNCTLTDSTKLIERCSPKMFIPSGFSPNFDGNNDFLFFSAENVSKINFKVFNRWGEKVFETTDVNAKWDGFYKGYPLPIGMYFWIAAFEGMNLNGLLEKKNDKGTFYILR